MADKRWTVNFQINELPAAHTWQSTSVEAANVGLAINRAWAEIKKRTIVKGKRVKSGKVTFSQEVEYGD